MNDVVDRQHGSIRGDDLGSPVKSSGIGHDDVAGSGLQVHDLARPVPLHDGLGWPAVALSPASEFAPMAVTNVTEGAAAGIDIRQVEEEFEKLAVVPVAVESGVSCSPRSFTKLLLRFRVPIAGTTPR